MPADGLGPDHLARRTGALLRWYRRPLAAALLTLAALSALGTADDAHRGRAVLIAARDLDSGHVVTAADVRSAELPVDAAPVTALPTPGDVVGRVVALPVRAGEVMTDVRVVGRPLLDALSVESGREQVAVTVPVSDPATLTVTRAGDVVDVLASGEGGTGGAVASGVRVLALVASADRTASDGAVVLAVARSDAAALARAVATSRLTLAVSARP